MLQIEDFDNKLCLSFLNKFLEQKETFKQLKNKLMIQGPQLRNIADHCWNLKVDYFALKETIAKRKENEAAEPTNIENSVNESEESDSNMDDPSEEYESGSQQEYRKLIQFLKNLIETNEKKFTGTNISHYFTFNYLFISFHPALIHFFSNLNLISYIFFRSYFPRNGSFKPQSRKRIEIHFNMLSTIRNRSC